MSKKNAYRGKTPRPMETGKSGSEHFVLPREGEVSLYHRLFEDVRAFLIEKYPDQVHNAYSVFAEVNQFEESDLEDEDFDDPLMVQFTDWLIHTPDVIKHAVTGVELYGEGNAGLGRPERDVLSRMNDSLVTLCEMQLSGSHDRVVFKDLLLDRQFEIQVDENMPPFPEGLLVAVRVITFSDGPALGLGSYPLLLDRETPLEMVRQLFEEYRREVPGATLEEFLKAENALLALWFEYMRDMGDGEEGDGDVPVYLAHFRVTDSREVRKRLKTIRALNEWQKDTFDWTGDSGDGGEDEFRGVVVLANGQLVLSAVSEELREAGKIMLLSSCRGLIRHTLDSVEKCEADEG